MNRPLALAPALCGAAKIIQTIDAQAAGQGQFLASLVDPCAYDIDGPFLAPGNFGQGVPHGRCKANAGAPPGDGYVPIY